MSKCDLSQSSDQNMDESIFTTTGIYIIVGASYVNLISPFAQLARANVCSFFPRREMTFFAVVWTMCAYDRLTIN